MKSNQINWQSFLQLYIVIFVTIINHLHHSCSIMRESQNIISLQIMIIENHSKVLFNYFRKSLFKRIIALIFHKNSRYKSFIIKNTLLKLNFVVNLIFAQNQTFKNHLNRLYDNLNLEYFYIFNMIALNNMIIRLIT